MMKRTQKASLEILCLLALSLFNLSCANQPTAMDTKMEKLETSSLWQCIDTLVKSIPFTQKKLETIFNVSITETYRNEYLIRMKGHNALLLGGQKIDLIDFRLGRIHRSDPGLLGLEVRGTCTTLDEVRLHYPVLEITDSPRGRSLDEVTSYTSIQPWGRLYFDFAERNPECLSGVVLAPKNNS